MIEEFCGSLPPPDLCISQEAWQAGPWHTIGIRLSSGQYAGTVAEVEF